MTCSSGIVVVLKRGGYRLVANYHAANVSQVELVPRSMPDLQTMVARFRFGGVPGFCFLDLPQGCYRKMPVAEEKGFVSHCFVLWIVHTDASCPQGRLNATTASQRPRQKFGEEYTCRSRKVNDVS